MAIVDSHLAEIDGATVPFRTNANAVVSVVEGEGETQVGGDTVKWRAKDIFTLPQGNWIVHRNIGKPARLFTVSDRDALARLAVLKEEYGNTAN